MKKSTLKTVAITISLGAFLLIPNYASAFPYIVQSGDSIWKLSQKFGVTMTSIRETNRLSSDSIWIGQVLEIAPNTSSNYITHSVKSGESLYILSRKYGVSIQAIMSANALSSSYILIGQNLKIPIPTTSQKPWITYSSHTVASGDTFWSLGLRYRIPYQEILDANGLSANSGLAIGQTLKIPVHHIPVKTAISSRHGALVDWWTEAQYVWPIGTTAKVTDLETGISWTMKRTMGASHADVEPLTSKDTQTMKSVWGGQWSWSTRAVIVEKDGHRMAASASAMPHSIDAISGNGFNGHSDIHFVNSRRHKDDQIDPYHQRMIQKAAGLQ